MPKFIIHTDGGSRGNPGPAAIGVVISAEAEQRGRISKNLRGSTPEVGFSSGSSNWVREYGEYIGERTNNQAEYEAVIFALKKLKQLIGSEKAGKAVVDIHLDSELLAKQLNGEYKIKEKEIQNLFIEVWNLKLDFSKVTFKHLLREENKRADKLVNQALDREESKLAL